jgi:dolichyl-phosphate-mannose--protein O-mannosyl transferase
MISATKELQKDHMFSSRPEQWPLMQRGVAYWLDRETNVSFPLKLD